MLDYYFEGDIMYIYKITNLINNKIYIGQTTKKIGQRFNKHISEAKCEINGTRPNNYFHNAINKFGEDNFSIEILERVDSLKELDEREKYWINYYNSTKKEIGYNLMTGGISGKKTWETKKKLSVKKMNNWQDEELAKRMREGLNKATLKWKQVSRAKHIEIICLVCGTAVRLPKWEAKDRKYCSKKCALSINLPKATLAAARVNSINAKINRDNFKEVVLDWSLNNRELILNCPKNKISTELYEIYDIAKEYNIVDWRTISKAISNKESRKDLLEYLRKYIENVC